MDVDEIEKEIKKTIEDIAENDDCYFLDEGVEYVEEYCPEIVDDIQTEEDLDNNLTNNDTGSTLNKIKDGLLGLLGEESYAAAKTTSYKSSHTWAYKPFSGTVMVKETLTVHWKVKSGKITSVPDPDATITYQKKFIKVVSCHYTKKAIASDKKTANVEVKTVYENKVSPFKRCTRKTGAKMTSAGKVTFHQ